MADGLLDVDDCTLSPVVREATGRPMLEFGTFSSQPLHGGGGHSPGIARYSGEATDRGDTVRWSLILKLLGHEAGAEAPNSWNYWRREADAYESGFLDVLPGRLRAPRCYAIHEFEPGLLGLWLEDVGEIDPVWSVAQYTTAASTLGEFAGGHAGDRSTADPAWLSRDWLRQYVENSAPMIDLLRRSADDPWVRRVFPPEQLEATIEIWDTREWCFAVLARLPHSLCHMDAFRRNLFSHPDGSGAHTTVAIDWAFVGRAAIGEELGPLVAASVALGDVELVDAPELERCVLDGYLDGLSSAGFECDDRLVRLGYVIAACLRYSIGPLENILPDLLDEEKHGRLEQLFDMPLPDICDGMLTRRRDLLGPLLGKAQQIERELALL